jgi:hypothetical protein
MLTELGHGRPMASGRKTNQSLWQDAIVTTRMERMDDMAAVPGLGLNLISMRDMAFSVGTRAPELPKNNLQPQPEFLSFLTYAEPLLTARLFLVKGWRMVRSRAGLYLTRWTPVSLRPPKNLAQPSGSSIQYYLAKMFRTRGAVQPNQISR